jgi:hypothetical protein
MFYLLCVSSSRNVFFCHPQATSPNDVMLDKGDMQSSAEVKAASVPSAMKENDPSHLVKKSQEELRLEDSRHKSPEAPLATHDIEQGQGLQLPTYNVPIPLPSSRKQTGPPLPLPPLPSSLTSTFGPYSSNT